MKTEQQRIAIAEACGWFFMDDSWHYPNGAKAIATPDYLNDLNAMNEAEKTLNDDELFRMSRFLQHITRSTLIGVAVMTASAPKRAEAFLKTIDKWTTNQNEL